MYKLRTTKQLKYFDEVIRLHYEEGYGEDRIASILPVGHTTVSRWIAIFESQQGEVPRRNERAESMETKGKEGQSAPEEELRELKRSYAKLQIELRKERMRADLLDEMINVGESMFKVPIRKKAGAKQ